MITKVIFCLLVLIYGVLMLFAGLIQFKNKSVTVLSPLFMTLGSILLLAALILMLLDLKVLILVLIPGLILIHISAIINGLKLQGKLTPSHHVVRLVFSIIVITLAIIS